MARKTFISYKYSESRYLRDQIIKKLGDDARFYTGETSESPNLTSFTNLYIKDTLKDMIFNTTVLIVIVSPNMLLSNWMEWEIKYALRNQSRNGYTSHPNGIVCVISKNPLYRGIPSCKAFEYSWAYDYNNRLDKNVLFNVLKKNMDNKKYSYMFSSYKDDYIVTVKEDDFLSNPEKYIEEAYNQSQNIDAYNIYKGE